MSYFPKINILFFCILLSLATASCKKNGAPVIASAYYFKSSIDGINYIDRGSAILPQGTTGSPSATYLLSENQGKYFSLSSNLKIEETPGSPNKYSLFFKLPVVEPLTIGKKYEVGIIDNEEYLQPREALQKYSTQNIPHAAISAIDGDVGGWCFGKGHVEFTSIDTEKDEVKGTVEFKLPSPLKSDNAKILILKGEFFCRIN
ncbi:MAG: hypothetical protein EOO20_04100 [Chryseobacterium sp.]|nr:MAG: hypothetical protein EOO20_04100 [Chryseobacterium sp.]